MEKCLMYFLTQDSLSFQGFLISILKLSYQEVD